MKSIRQWFKPQPLVPVPSIEPIVEQPVTAPVVQYQPEPRPAWLQKELWLPTWARVSEEPAKGMKINLLVDMEKAYPEWLALLGVTQDSDIDQYWLECAYQCIKLDMQSAIQRTEFDVRVSQRWVQFRFLRAPKYALDQWPEGRGVNAATKDREAREHYRRIRGFLPMSG